MSAKTKRIERSQRFRRAWRGQTRTKAVSPVVATLILILIAVAAAAALYLWLVAWQGGVTGTIGSPGAQYTLTIGGSTSVYPFASEAAKQFEQNNTDVVVSVNQGGSGAGMAAVCTGQVDIGEASAFYTASTLETSYGCPTTLNQQIVAYDGVDLITQTANVHAIQSMSWDTLQSVISDSSSTTPTSGIQFVYSATTPSLTLNGVTLTSAELTAAGITQGSGFAWDQLPAFAAAENGITVAGTTFAPTTGGLTAATTLGADEASCTVAPYTHDLCTPVTDEATATTCGWTICAGGSGTYLAGATVTSAIGQPAATVHIEYRSDVSGTTQSFLSRLVAAGTTTTTGTTVSLGFSGCGGDNQFDGCGGSYNTAISTGSDGNPLVIAATAGDADALGYASDGLVWAGGSGVVPVNFQGYGQSVIVVMNSASTDLKNIAGGIAAYDSGSWSATLATAYVGWRPFLNVETTPPTGEALRYLQFVMDPANNENLAAEANEISVYASGLAGVVPVTPITGYQIG